MFWAIHGINITASNDAGQLEGALRVREGLDVLTDEPYAGWQRRMSDDMACYRSIPDRSTTAGSVL